MRVLHILNHTGRFNGNVRAAVDLACAQLFENDEVGILVDAQAPGQIAQNSCGRVADEKLPARWRADSQINLARLSLQRVAEETVAVYVECLTRNADARRSVDDVFRSDAASVRPPN